MSSTSAPSSALTSARRLRVSYDVTSVVDEPGRWLVSAQLLLPALSPGADAVTVLCCIPGGGCTGDYFDLGEPAAGFSFAEHAVAAGLACVLIDNLGTGRSTRYGDCWLSPQSVARAAVEAFDSAIADLRAALDITTVRTVAVGHSMGAMLALMGQAMTNQYQAVACLGFTPAGLPNVLTGEELRVAAAGPVAVDVLTCLAAKRFSTPMPVAKDSNRPEPFPFQLPDTDSAALAALRAAATNLLPLPGLLSLMPGNICDYIRQITVPVFIGGGDHEPWHKAGELVGAFENCTDITFYTLVNSAHNHNVATTRQLLWQRLAAWAAAVAIGSPTPQRRSRT